MTETGSEDERVYHLVLDAEEAAQAAQALRLLISDEAHQPAIRRVAREALAKVERSPDAHGLATAALEAAEMKLTHTAVHLLLDDLQREQSDRREILKRILEKLPDEHTMRAIELDEGGDGGARRGRRV